MNFGSDIFFWLFFSVNYAQPLIKEIFCFVLLINQSLLINCFLKLKSKNFFFSSNF